MKGPAFAVLGAASVDRGRPAVLSSLRRRDHASLRMSGWVLLRHSWVVCAMHAAYKGRNLRGRRCPADMT